MTDWGLVGSDPAPGDVGAIRLAAQSFGTISSNAQTASGQVSQLVGQVHSGGYWTGKAATAWADTARNLPPDLDKLAVSYGEAASALNTYAETLAVHQARAQQILTDAALANVELTRADSAMYAAKARSDPGAAAELAQAIHERQYAAQRLDVARRDINSIRENIDTAADRLRGALVRASDHGIQNRNAVIKFLSGTVAAAAWTASAVASGFTVENVTAALDMVSSVLGTVAFVAMFVPGPIGLAVAGAAGIASFLFGAAALGGRAILVSRGQASAESFYAAAGMTLLSAIPAWRFAGSAKSVVGGWNAVGGTKSTAIGKKVMEFTGRVQHAGQPGISFKQVKSAVKMIYIPIGLGKNAISAGNTAADAITFAETGQLNLKQPTPEKLYVKFGETLVKEVLK